MQTIDTDVLILGGGVAGLAAAADLGAQATVLEKEERPGGLVRTECFSGYWFDRVLHLLHINDEPTFARIQSLMEGTLVRCPPVAFIETEVGTVRFPFQMHLAGLTLEAKVACIAGLVAQMSDDSIPENYEQMLLKTFGRAMCDTFFFPYNRKMWRRPLSDLSASGFQWNIARPTLEEVLRGAFDESVQTATYNSNGWYPQPGKDAELRGMELLSTGLAKQAVDLRLRHRVVEIDPDANSVLAETEGETLRFRYRNCVSTLPLPWTLRLCSTCPNDLAGRVQDLPYNSVLSAAFCIEGPRPEPRGLWRYYTSERLSFTRLVHMHEFDPESAPPEGWGLMAELPRSPEEAQRTGPEILAQVRAELEAVGAIPPGSKIVGEHLMASEAGYVVFTPGVHELIQQAHAYLRGAGIEPLGRYGRWEYSSMAQVVRDGFKLAKTIRDEG